MLAQCVYYGFRMGEASCPTRYFAEASSINIRRNVKHGLEVLATSVAYRLQKICLANFKIFSPKGRRLDLNYYTVAEADSASSQTAR